MRYIFFTNGQVGRDVLRWLVSRGEPPVGLVVHPAARARCREEAIAASGLGADRIFNGLMLRQHETIEAIAALKPDLGLSIFFDYILKDELLALFPSGCLNLHPAYLPYNRGQYPNVWNIVEGTPAGATLHYMDAGIDTGDILAQRAVSVEPTDTGHSLYARLEEACLQLFRDSWPVFLNGKLARIPQAREAGTVHRTRDVERIDPIDLDREYRAGDLINILRARTFPPYAGAYFMHNGTKIYMRLQLLTEEQL